MTLGPVMLDLSGPKLTVVEKEMLCHPLAGGVILFARNFEFTRQFAALTGEIRVQRFQEGFTRIPLMRMLGEGWGKDPSQARAIVEVMGYVIARELRSHNID